MLPVRHLAPRILMTVHYCGRLLACILEWTALAYHKREGTTLHPRARRRTLQYDGRPDGHFGVWVGTWNLGSVSEKGEVYEELRKRIFDLLFTGSGMERTWYYDAEDEWKEI